MNSFTMDFLYLSAVSYDLSQILYFIGPKSQNVIFSLIEGVDMENILEK